MKRTTMLVLLALTGCAAQPDVRSNPEAMEPLVCTSKVQCDAWWQRSQAWVAGNSTWKIQTASDAIIQTYGPGNSRVDMAYTITREANADGSARIVFRAACDNFIRCHPTLLEAVLSFKRYVRAAG